MKRPYRELQPLTLRYMPPNEMLDAIERTGRQVSVPIDMLPPQFNNYGARERPAFTTPADCGLRGGSFREIDGRIRSQHGLRTMSRLVACNFALEYPREAVSPDILLVIDFVTGPDGKPYVFCVENHASRGPTFLPLYLDKPDDGDKMRDYIAPDQHLLYLAPT